MTANVVIRGTLHIDPMDINIGFLKRELVDGMIKPLSWGYARLAHTAYRRYVYGWGRRAKPRLYLRTTTNRSITTGGKRTGAYGAYASYRHGSLIFLDFGTFYRTRKMPYNYRRRTDPNGGFAIRNLRRKPHERRTTQRIPSTGGITQRGLTDAIIDQTWMEYYEAILRGTYVGIGRAYLASKRFVITTEASS